MSAESLQKLKDDTIGVKEIAGALHYIGAIGNANNPGSGDEAISWATTLDNAGTFCDSVIAILDADPAEKA
jgi:hypothetical protein